MGEDRISPRLVPVEDEAWMDIVIVEVRSLDAAGIAILDAIYLTLPMGLLLLKLSAARHAILDAAQIFLHQMFERCP
jgi:hypothetical protein